MVFSKIPIESFEYYLILIKNSFEKGDKKEITY